MRRLRLSVLIFLSFVLCTSIQARGGELVDILEEPITRGTMSGAGIFLRIISRPEPPVSLPSVRMNERTEKRMKTASS